jgi:hypothetical protein
MGYTERGIAYIISWFVDAIAGLQMPGVLR